MTAALVSYFKLNDTIEEHFGNLNYGSARPPQSNAQYGTTESPLEQVNGNPVSDALYTLPFALWGLHEAYLVTNDTYFQTYLNYLTEFLMKSQILVENEQYSAVNGAWYRAFDFVKWEFFASASDVGWGPTSIESGWTVGEILQAFGMIETRQSFWDVVCLYNFTQIMNQYIPIFGLPSI